MSNKTKIALVVLAGRDRNNLTRLLDSFRMLSELPDELIIVYDMKNHGVPDILPVMAECKLVGVSFYGNRRQPQMRNLGLKNSESDFVWFVDDDVSLDKNSIKNLRIVIGEINDNLEVGVIAGRIIEEASFDVSKLVRPIYLSLVRGAVGYFNYDDCEFPKDKYKNITGSNENQYPNIPFVQGTSMVFRRSYLKEIGGFDEDLGLGYASFEDAEPCFAMRKMGWSTIYCGKFSLEHHKLARVGGITRGHDDYEYTSYLIRNYTIALLKNGFPSTMTAPFYLLVFSIGHIFRVAYHINGVRIRFGAIKIFWLSLVAILKGLRWGVGALIQSKFKRINTAD